jgi:bacterioferritin (cytochrome b1)
MPDNIEAQHKQSQAEALDRDELVEKLNALLGREYNSLIRYIRDANPYVPQERASALPLLDRIIAGEGRHAEQLGNLIIQLDGIPQPAPYDVSIADINYLSLDYLADMMINEKHDLVQQYERLIAQTSDLPDVREALRRNLAEERLHLDALKGLFSPHPTE